MPEKMYVVCEDCGESFDDLAIAKEHEGNFFHNDGADGLQTYEILPESEAM